MLLLERCITGAHCREKTTGRATTMNMLLIPTLLITAALTLSQQFVGSAAYYDDAVVLADFSHLKCLRESSNYGVESFLIALPSSKFCFTLTSLNAPVACSDMCCSARFDVLEINVKSECGISGMDLQATLNGVPTTTAPAFLINDQGGSVLRITGLGLDPSTANGAEICLTLGPNADGDGCLDLESLCVPPEGNHPAGTCNTVLFDPEIGCCSVNTFPASSLSRIIGDPEWSMSTEVNPTPDLLSPVDPAPNSPSPVSPAPPPPTVVDPSPPPNQPQVQPQPSPPTTPAPCKVCIKVTLNPAPLDYRPYRFNPENCRVFQETMSKSLNDIILGYGKSYVSLFTPNASLCDPLEVRVCGTFGSEAEVRSIQDEISMLAAMAQEVAIGTSANLCHPSLENYGVYPGIDACFDDIFTSMVPTSCNLKDTVNITSQCNQAPLTLPFMVSTPYTQRPSGNTISNLYCFNIFVKEDIGQSLCTDTDTLSKIDLYANQNLRSSIRSIRLFPTPGTGANVSLSPSWGPAGSNSLKATRVNWNKAQAANASICLEVRKPVTMRDICGYKCFVFPYNANKDCCPIFRVAHNALNR